MHLFSWRIKQWPTWSHLIFCLNIPLWIQVCTGAPQFYSYKSWGYRSPPQGNLYRMGVHRFFFASFSLKNGEAKVQNGQVLFLYWGAGFTSVTQNQDETYFHDLGHGGAHTAFFRGCFGDLFEGTRTPMLDGFSGFRRACSDLKLNETELTWFELNGYEVMTLYYNLKHIPKKYPMIEPLLKNRLTCLRAVRIFPSESAFL